MTFITTASQYDPALLAFDHEGAEIRNPFLSPDGMEIVDPVATYGFAEIHTGGGCMALSRALPCGGSIILTDNDGSELPYQREMAEALIGRWDKEGEQLACMVLGMVPLVTAKRVFRVEVVQVVERTITLDVLAPSSDGAKAVAVFEAAGIQDADWSSPQVRENASYPTHSAFVLVGK
jgi:hypothetical protein